MRLYPFIGSNNSGTEAKGRKRGRSDGTGETLKERTNLVEILTKAKVNILLDFRI